MNPNGRPFKSKYPLETKLTARGYAVLVRHDRDSYEIKEHRLIAEKALGKPLPEKAEVHHHNRVRSDNRNNNLVLCPDRAYHSLLHTRMRAKEVCGDPKKRKCKYCKAYDKVEYLYVDSACWTSHYHENCKIVFDRIRRQNKKQTA